MSLLEIMKKRKSVRAYLPKEPNREDILSCLEAARLAPSACNIQPYKLFTLKGKIKDEFCAKVFTGIYSACSFAAQAPVMVAIVSTSKKLKGLLGNQVQGTNFSLIDIGIAGEHLVLEAAARGLGSCWLGWFSKKEADKFLSLGFQEKTEILICLGYAKEDPPSRPRKNEKELFIFKE